MTQEELKAKIQELKDAAENLDEPDKTFKLIDVRNLDSQLAGMALEELRQKLEQIRLIDLREIDQQIATAKNAIQAHEARVNAFDTAIGILKTALGLVL